MTNGVNRTVIVLVIIGWAVSSQLCRAAPATAEPPPNTVVITIKPTAAVPGRLVLLADVAKLEGGSDELRECFGRLDLANPPKRGEEIRITKRQVLYRILLAGYGRPLFTLKGAESVTVRLAEHTVGVEQFVEAAMQAVRALVPAGPEQVQLRPLRKPAQDLVLQGVLAEQVELVPVLKPFRNLSGQIMVPVEVHVDGRLHSREYVTIGIQVYDVVPIARRTINPGEKLTAQNVQFRRMPIDGRTEVPRQEQVIGRRARRLIRPLQPITRADLAQPEGPAPVIKPRQIVELIAQRPGLRVTARGESLQSARIGDIIRVRNVDSKAVVVGRVIGPGTVEVQF